MLGQHRNVLEAIAQWRQTNLDCVETEKQILTKTSLRYFSVQIGVCRRQQTHVDLLRLRRSDAFKLTRLQHAQQLRLQIQRHVSDLVEKERPPSASSKRPTRSLFASVNAPRT